MKKLGTRWSLHCLLFCILFAAMPVAALRAETGIGPSFKGPVGLQLYSLRDKFAKDVAGSLDEVKAMGFRYVELAGTYGMPPREFRRELESRGLKPVSAHYSFDEFATDVDKIAREAKELGVEYVGTAWIGHQGDFDEKTCRHAIEVFNTAGKKLSEQGLKLFYHTHGYEFQPYGSGTLFDLLMTETKPEYVCFQMDVFWVVHAGQNPATLFEKYGDRFALLHLKDMKQGTPIGLLTGSSDVTNDVVLGTGRIDFRRTLAAAKKAGAKWYFIEDESPTSERQIPLSLQYLEQVTW